MADAFYGEIRMFPFGYTPIGWLPCNGQTLNILHYQVLYALLGKRFGGDGNTTFCLPNLNGRIPVGEGISAQTGSTFVFAQTVGQETVTLHYNQGPSHTHSFNDKLSTAGSTGMTGVAQTGPDNVGTSLLSRALNTAAKPINAYDVPPSDNVTQLGAKVSQAYGNAALQVDPHPNLQPYLVMAYYICNDGEWPPKPD